MFAPSLLFFLIGLLSFSWAQLNLLAGNPLLSGSTSYTFNMLTITKNKPTSCFIESGSVSQCRRKRGILERPQLIQFDDYMISPSKVFGIETTADPVASDSRFDSNSLLSSFNEEMEYRTSQNLFRQLVANGQNNLFTVGDCGQTTVNLSQFMECLGLSIQATTILTATFTETKTISTGFTTFTVAGCTPSGFPYPSCPTGSTSSTSLLGGLAGTVTSVVNNLLPSPVAGIVNPILTPITNVVSSTLPLPGQGSTGGLLTGLLPGGTSNLPVVGQLSGQGSTTSGSLPVVGGLLTGSQGGIVGGLPILGGLPGLGGFPFLGGVGVQGDELQPVQLSYRYSYV